MRNPKRILATLVAAAVSVAAATAFAAGPTNVVVSPNPAMAGQTVTVSLSGPGCGGGIVAFGDGGLAEFTLPGVASVTHVYANAGTFSVTTSAEPLDFSDLPPALRNKIKGDPKCKGGPVTLTVRSLAMREPAPGLASARPTCPPCFNLVGDGGRVPFACVLQKPTCPTGMTWFDEPGSVGCRAANPHAMRLEVR